MSYTTWFNKHAFKHKTIVDKLVKQGFNEDEIIDYFEFNNMVQKENDFCPLYAKNKKCHEMKELNCYLCACPHFRFNDDGLDKYNDSTILSKCDINNGSKIKSGDVIHHNCSSCSVPHHKHFIKKHFDLDWKKIMNECDLHEV